MKKLTTIQKREKLNDIYVVDDIGPGGAHHRYVICEKDDTRWANGNNDLGIVGEIYLQKGARKDEDATHGVIDSDLLEIARHRLQYFQDGPFKSEYNAKALEHIEMALMYMNRRVEDRIERNVLGTYNK